MMVGSAHGAPLQHFLKVRIRCQWQIFSSNTLPNSDSSTADSLLHETNPCNEYCINPSCRGLRAVDKRPFYKAAAARAYATNAPQKSPCPWGGVQRGSHRGKRFIKHGARMNKNSNKKKSSALPEIIYERKVMQYERQAGVTIITPAQKLRGKILPLNFTGAG